MLRLGACCRAEGILGRATRLNLGLVTGVARGSVFRREASLRGLYSTQTRGIAMCSCSRTLLSSSSVPKQAADSQTTDELSSSGSTANTAERRHEQQGKDAAAATEGAAGEPLWKDCDTPEDIMAEERYGSDDEPAPEATPEHLQLALKALIYGTIWAIVGTLVAACVVAKICGFSSWSEVKHHLSSRSEREVERLKAAGTEVIYYELDLLNPGAVPDQAQAIMKKIQELSADDDEPVVKTTTMESSSAQS